MQHFCNYVFADLYTASEGNWESFLRDLQFPVLERSVLSCCSHERDLCWVEEVQNCPV